MILKVARLGHPIVRTAARQVTEEEIKSQGFQVLIDSMVETMHEYSGVGLAATQIHLPLQVAVLEVERNPRYPDAPPVPLTVLINPVVTILDDRLIDGYEGCLSIPDMRGMVPRFTRLRVEGLDATRSRWTSSRRVSMPESSSTKPTISRAKSTSTVCVTCAR